MQELEKRAVASLDAKHLMTSLKRVVGEKYLEIPVIIPGNENKPGRFPESKLESLNNLAREFSQVGANSSRSSSYSEKFHSNRQRAAQKLSDMLPLGARFDEFKKKVADDVRFDIGHEKIKEIIDALDDTSCGPDEIPAIFLKKTSPVCSHWISYILRSSLHYGFLPQQFLRSNITPVVKNPLKSQNFFTNYRPISLTSIVARVCERAISIILLEEIEDNGGIRDIQFGARKGMGTSEALTYVVLGINRSLAKDGVCHGAFGDISKAFDRVDPLLLAWKMLKKGIDEVLVRWVYSFLITRKLRVKVGEDFSDWFSVDSGIPQGTVLGPLLWLIWIDDCPIDAQGSMELQRDPESGCLFVDDIFLFSRGSEKRQVEDLNNRLSKLYE